MTDFARHFKKVRESKGMTPYRLAQLTGLSKQGALNLELPGADPKLSTLLVLAKALDVWPWELLPGWKESTPVDDARSARKESAPVEAKSPREVDREKRAKRDRAAKTRWLNNLKKKMANDAKFRNPALAARDVETPAEWVARLAKLPESDLEFVHPATQPELRQLFLENGVKWPLEYVPPPPAPPTPRAAYTGKRELESLARACEPYLRHAWMWTERGSAAWSSSDLHMNIRLLVEAVFPTLSGKSTPVDQRLKAITPALKDLAENLRPNRRWTRPGQPSPYIPQECQAILLRVFASLELAPSGMTTEESIEYSRMQDRVWREYRKTQG